MIDLTLLNMYLNIPKFKIHAAVHFSTIPAKYRPWPFYKGYPALEAFLKSRGFLANFYLDWLLVVDAPEKCRASLDLT